MKRYILILTICIIIIFAGCSSEEQSNETDKTYEGNIVCNTFELVTQLKGSSLELSLNTDLPGNTVVSVSVSRSYWEKGNPDYYSLDYFSERSTVNDWQATRSISVSNDKWNSDLKDYQEKMSRLGFGFDVEAIGDKITISGYVPINQPDPKFGDGNKNLVGEAVRDTAIRVEDEIEIQYPLESPLLGQSLPSLNPISLDKGQCYTVSKKTPLMPSPNPDDPIEAMAEIKQIPIGGRFEVVQMINIDDNPWYEVDAFNNNMVQIGSGFINSIALIGQDIYMCY